MNTIVSSGLLMRDVSSPAKEMVGTHASPKLKLSLKPPESHRLPIVRSTPYLSAASDTCLVNQGLPTAKRVVPDPTESRLIMTLMSANSASVNCST